MLTDEPVMNQVINSPVNSRATYTTVSWVLATLHFRNIYTHPHTYPPHAQTKTDMPTPYHHTNTQPYTHIDTTSYIDAYHA